MFSSYNENGLVQIPRWCLIVSKSHMQQNISNQDKQYRAHIQSSVLARNWNKRLKLVLDLCYFKCRHFLPAEDKMDAKTKAAHIHTENTNTRQGKRSLYTLVQIYQVHWGKKKREGENLRKTSCTYSIAATIHITLKCSMLTFLFPQKLPNSIQPLTTPSYPTLWKFPFLFLSS